MGQWWVGIDLGGTNVRAAGVDRDGRVLAAKTQPLDSSPLLEPFGQLVEIVEGVAKAVGSPPQAIGLGATGPVSSATGIISNPWTLPSSMQGDVRHALQVAFSVGVAVENDANAAALAEAWLGAGRDARTLVCITVGTGIGVGVVNGGRVHRGPDGIHPEAGHLVVDPQGPACYCGNNGCVESLASATALVGRTRALGGPPALLRAEQVVAAASAGEPVSGRVVQDARRALITAARSLVAVHAADHLILTGGAVPDPRALRTETKARLEEFVFAPATGTKVTAADLGGRAGMIGAARLAMTT